MANNWKIRSMLMGVDYIPTSLFGALGDPQMFNVPFTAFLLTNGEENVLVDTGEEYFSEDGTKDASNLLNALAEDGLTPDDITSVIYTHLHHDHAGNSELFTNAVAYIQKKEYDNMLNQYPIQTARGVYAKDVAEKISHHKRIILVDGDMTLANGLTLLLTPGHSLGGQSIVVPTAKGRYVLTGDTPGTRFAMFPWIDKFPTLEGDVLDLTPCTDGSMKYLDGFFTMDIFPAFDSHEKQLAYAERPEPEFIIPSHDPENIAIKTWG